MAGVKSVKKGAETGAQFHMVVEKAVNRGGGAPATGERS